MVSADGLFMWYPCSDASWKLFYDEIFGSYGFGGQFVYPKVAADTFFSAIGIVPNSATYQMLLNSIGGTITPANAPPFSPMAVIDFPPSLLNEMFPAWQAYLQNPTPCPLVDPRTPP